MSQSSIRAIVARRVGPDAIIARRDDKIAELGIDSFDFANMRIECEGALGREIMDGEWAGIATLADLLALEERDGTAPDTRFYHAARGAMSAMRERAEGDGNGAPNGAHGGLAEPAASFAFDAPAPSAPSVPRASPGRHRRAVRIDMPQMILGGLSEAWLAKEIGDVHWQLICAGLGVRSIDLKDDQGRRLYATFTRLRYALTGPLTQVAENAEGFLEGTLSLFSSSMCFSSVHGRIGGVEVTASCMTTFSSREHENKNDLVKSRPADAFHEDIRREPFYPDFAQTYALMRKTLSGGGSAVSIGTLGEEVTIDPAAPIHSGRVEIEPFSHINGANLLYFAAYHNLSDLAERARVLGEGGPDIARFRSTVGRDICYFSNAEIGHAIRYDCLAAREGSRGGHVTAGSLTNETTGRLMATVITTKADVTPA